MKNIFPYRKSLFLGVVLAFTCLVVLVASAWSPHINPGQNDYEVKNRTRSLKVVNAQKSIESLRLSLRNEYDQNITAYAVSITKDQSTFVFKEDFIYGDKPVTPGKLFIVDIPLPSSAVFPQEVNILAVVLGDKTEDGDREVAREIRESRLGEKMQLQRIIPLMEEALTAPDADMAAALNRLKSQVSSLQDPSDKAMSEAVKSGFRSNKEGALGEVQRLEKKLKSPEYNVRERLAKLKESYEKLFLKL